MAKRQERISPRQFDAIQRQLLRSELEGHGPETCVMHACNAGRIDPPKPFEPVELIVDPSLSDMDYVRGIYGAPEPK